MVIQVSIVSFFAYLFCSIKYRKDKIKQQVTFLIIYLIGLTIVGELDVLLPIYFVFSLLPFLFRLRRISKFTGILIVYFGAYLVIGMTMQNTVAAIVTFISKIWQYIVFFIVMDAEIKIEDSDYKNLLRIGVIAESLLGLYLLFSSTNIDKNSGLVRLVSNAQPISGNIATAMLPISVIYYMYDRGNSKSNRRVLWLNLVFLIWIILSGTRGYTLEYSATMVLIFYDYFTNSRVGRTSRQNRIFVAAALALIAVAIVVVVPGILEKASSILRLKGSVGIRTYENAAVRDYFRTSTLLTQFFGIGIGGTGGECSSMHAALYRQFSMGMWNRNHYLYDSGALFHNLYANVLMNLGLLGILMIVAIYVKMWRRITNCCRSNIMERRIMHLFQFSFALMNYFRWSAVCGIAEMIIFALILRKIQKQDGFKYSICENTI